MPKENKPSGYNYSRVWFDFALYNPHAVTGNHTALYLWLVELNNRLKWLESFGLTYREGMDGMSCKSRTTYNKCFKNLVEWGFIKIVKKSRNQYEANMIALSKNVQAKLIWQDKICTTNGISTGTTNGISTGTIPKTVKQENIKTFKMSDSPTIEDCIFYFTEKKQEKKEAESFFKKYEGLGWKINGSPIEKWQSIADIWISKIFNQKNNNYDITRTVKSERKPFKL